tara:strand:+ start:255 stop:989 length:735 start_codon:yes stop_codon:yes gene_type:complete
MTKEIFLSHAWGKDNLDRDNHLRVKQLSKVLEEQGYSVWLDENNMIGNIDNSIMKGINNCKVVIICLTENYCNKINTCVYENLSNDNCYKEWNYCLFKQKKIIPLIMEPKMHDIFLRKDGVIQMYLNNQMYINYSNDEYEENELSILYKTLRQYKVLNNNEKTVIRPNNSFEKFLHILPLSPNQKRKMGSPKRTPNKINIIVSEKKPSIYKKIYINIKYTACLLRKKSIVDDKINKSQKKLIKI